MTSWKEEIRSDLHRLDARIDRLILLFIAAAVWLGGILLAVLLVLAIKH
jgi:hypothetical protein